MLADERIGIFHVVLLFIEAGLRIHIPASDTRSISPNSPANKLGNLHAVLLLYFIPRRSLSLSCLLVIRGHHTLLLPLSAGCMI